MKTKDLAKAQRLDNVKLDLFLKNSKYQIKESFTGVSVNDSDVDSILADFNQYLVEEKNRKNEIEAARIAEKNRIEQEEENKRKALASMLITSGFNFDGYTIIKYSGYISGDDAVQVERGSKGVFINATNVGDALMNSLVEIRRNALAELKEAAYALGCNAVIGVDFDYITLDPQVSNSWDRTVTEYLPYVFGVTANGNAVVIEKNSR
jgi:uncharacterized protein YbjQ (UPF0145 family)